MATQPAAAEAQFLSPNIAVEEAVPAAEEAGGNKEKDSPQSNCKKTPILNLYHKKHSFFITFSFACLAMS